eukprot:1151724-Pelagomonas_calceolata.AAC.5
MRCHYSVLFLRPTQFGGGTKEVAVHEMPCRRETSTVTARMYSLTGIIWVEPTQLEWRCTTSLGRRRFRHSTHHTQRIEEERSFASPLNIEDTEGVGADGKSRYRQTWKRRMPVVQHR